jgi:hypothetical protein
MTDIGRSRMRWRQAFFVLLAAALVTIGGLLIALFGHGATPTYAEQSHRDTDQDLAVALRLLNAEQPPPTRAAMLRTLRRQNPSAAIATTDSTISIGQLTFRFARSGRLQDVAHPALNRTRH